MTPPIRPDDSPNVELELAKLANDAMAAGHDAHEVTARLYSTISYLRRNPKLAEQATNALADGVSTPADVSRGIWEHAQANPEPHGATGSWADSDLADTSALGNLSRSFVQGATLGGGHKLTAAAGAMLDKASGLPFGESYHERLAAERGAAKEFSEAHPVESLASEAAGGVTGALVGGAAVRGLRAAGEVAGVIAPRTATAIDAARELGTGSKLGRFARTTAIGAGYGGATGAIEADSGNRLHAATQGAERGAAATAVLAPVAGGVAFLGQKAGIPQLVSRGAEAIAGKLPDGRTKSVLQDLAETVGARGKAASEIGDRVGMDTRAGYVGAPRPEGVPAMALDEAGPNVEGLAKSVLRRPGEGKAILGNALRDRQARMRPAVTRALDELSGTTAASGDRLVSDLADEHAAIDKATESATASAKVKPAAINPLRAWRDEVGGSLADGISALRQHVQERGDQARQLYADARRATAGQPVESETLQQILETPAGKAAYAWARAQKGNRMSALPTVEKSVDESPSLNMLVELGVPREKAIVALGGEVETKTVPDPEALHYMKQALGKMARLGLHDGSGGTIATQAQGALGLWGQIRDELPDVWRKADDAFASKSRVIDALNKGRDVMRTQPNPPGRKALSTSLDAVEQSLGKTSPEEQAAFRVGAQSAVTEWLRNGGSPTRLARQLAEPTSAMSRRIVLATGDPDAPSRLASSLTPAAPARSVVPALSPESRAASRGLDIVRTPVVPTGAAPEKSLTILEQAKADMSPTERSALQRGAAQAVRGEFAGSAAQSPGRVFSSSPERVRQVAEAFPSTAAGHAFQQRVAAWDASQARGARLLGGSDTQANFAEDAARDHTTQSAVGQLAHGNVGLAAKALLTGTAKETEQRVRRLTDEEIAKLLTTSDGETQALRVSLRRERARRRTSQVVARAAVAGSDSGKP